MAKKETIKDRFLKVMAIAIAERWNGVKNKKMFAEALGMIPQQIYNLETAEDRNVTVEQIELLCKKFGAQPNYIILGMGAMRFGSEKTLEERIKIIEAAVLKNKKPV